MADRFRVGLLSKLLITATVVGMVVVCASVVVSPYDSDDSSVFGLTTGKLSRTVDEAVQVVGVLIFDHAPLGRVVLPDYSQPLGLRLAVLRSFSLWEDTWGTGVPSVGSFVFKLAGVSVLPVLVVLLYRRSGSGVVDAWLSNVSRWRAILSVWFVSTGIAAFAMLITNLSWMLWVKVYWVFYAETVANEMVVHQGKSHIQTVIPGWSPVAMQTIAQSAVGLGGIALYFLLVVMVVDKSAYRGAVRFGYCANCGYSRFGKTSSICPECGIGESNANGKFRGRKRRTIRLFLFFGCFVLLSTPLWLAWVAPILPAGIFD